MRRNSGPFILNSSPGEQRSIDTHTMSLLPLTRIMLADWHLRYETETTRNQILIKSLINSHSRFFIRTLWTDYRSWLEDQWRINWNGPSACMIRIRMASCPRIRWGRSYLPFMTFWEGGNTVTLIIIEIGIVIRILYANPWSIKPMRHSLNWIETAMASSPWMNSWTRVYMSVYHVHVIM